MKRLTLAVGFGAIAAVIAGCGGGSPEAPAGESAPAASAPAAQNIEVTFKSEPDPPKSGENTFEAMVMSGGQPVTDADVSLEFFMPAMPAMKMPEMRNSVPLKHEGAGRYRGAGNVMMAGSWDVTVSVKRNGQEIGSRKLEVAAN
jgi:membrane fusion protein, copper/silver efflux system